MASTKKSAANALRVKKADVRTAALRDAYITILRTAEALQRQLAELLRPVDLSMAQFNVLRILRGAGAAGLSCGEVSERLIRYDPDITRLLDRLEARGLTERTRDARDRRVVLSRITSKGLALLADLDAPVDRLHEAQVGHIDDGRLAALTEVLQEVHERLP